MELNLSVLRAQLSDDDWRVRKDAAQIASRNVANEALREVLVEGLLQPDDVGLRNACVEAFSRIDVGAREHAIHALSDAMRRATPTARKFVCAALSHVGGDALPLLRPLTLDSDVMTASAAMEALTSVGRDEADESGGVRDEVRQILVAALRRSEDVVIAAALSSLRELGGEIPIAPLRPLLERAALRSLAVMGLSQVEASSARALILSLLRSPDTVREAAMALAAQLERSPESEATRDFHAESVAAIHDLPATTRTKLVHAIAGISINDARGLIPLLLEAGVIEALPLMISRGLDFEGDSILRHFLAARGPSVLPALGLFIEGTTNEVAASWALQVAVDIANDDGTPATLDLVTAYARGLIVRNLSVADAWATLDAWGLAQARASTSLPAPTQPTPMAQHSRVPANIADVHALLSSPLVEERLASLDRLDLATDAARFELASMALADEDERVQIGALRALSRITSEPSRAGAFEQVKAMSAATSEELRVEATSALARLWTPAESAIASREWLRLAQDASPRVVIAALRGAHGIDVEASLRMSVLDALFEHCVAHPDPEVVKEAATAAAFLLNQRHSSALQRLLAHPHWSVRLRTIELMAACTSPSLLVKEALRAHLRMESDELVLQELRALIEVWGRP